MNKTDETEDEFFVNKRELGELFDSRFDLDVNLWRGQKPSERGAPPLYPILKAYKLSNGKMRHPDIETYPKNGTLWVKSTSGGVSLFDVIGVPVKRWDYYKIPIGARIPLGLVITKDSYNKAYEATYYSIRPNWDMPVSKFCILLDEFTSELIKEVK